MVFVLLHLAWAVPYGRRPRSRQVDRAVAPAAGHGGRVWTGWILSALKVFTLPLAILSPTVALGQVGEILRATVHDVAGDPFQCGGGGACQLHYRIFHILGGTPEVNMGTGMDGRPKFRARRGFYETHSTISGNFPRAYGRFDVPFFVVWDGVLNPGSPQHVGYYGAQSQIVHHGEVGNSNLLDCSRGGRSEACFEPLARSNAAQPLRNGIPAAGGLSPIPVPSVVSSRRGRIVVEWEQARGMTILDGAPPGILGYRLFVFRGREPSETALSGAVPVFETQSLGTTRAEVSSTHPALAGAGEVVFVLKLVYQGGLQSIYFSANSEPVDLQDGEGDGDEEEGTADDLDGDGIPDDQDNCPERENPDQRDTDGDGLGDACDPDADGEEKEPPAPQETAAPAPSTSSTAGVPAGSGGAPVGEEAGAGLKGAQDPDGDGVTAAMDDCPGFYDPAQSDQDHDGVGDACDPDADGDGVADDEDCNAADPLAGEPPPSIDPILNLRPAAATLLTWKDGSAPLYQIQRGHLPIHDPLHYSHTCFKAGLTRTWAQDLESPPLHGALYYLVNPESACGAALPGRASDGSFRPMGAACLEAALQAVEGSDQGRPQESWGLEVSGGGGDLFQIDLVLRVSADLADLHAVSVEVVFDPGLVSPAGSPLAGPLLTEATARSLVELSAGNPGPGRLRLTLSRTSLEHGVPAGTQGILVSTHWHALVRGQFPFRLEHARAFSSDQQPLPLHVPARLFHVLVR
ncbi:MAG: thrombospondin type 3 repeat-containing protein [Acidobacteriota bacterium]